MSDHYTRDDQGTWHCSHAECVRKNARRKRKMGVYSGGEGFRRRAMQHAASHVETDLARLRQSAVDEGFTIDPARFLDEGIQVGSLAG